jgi:hypothetical protein
MGKTEISFDDLRRVREVVKTRQKGWSTKVHQLYQSLVDDSQIRNTSRHLLGEVANLFDSVGAHWRARKIDAFVYAFPNGGLNISAIAEHKIGKASGMSTLSLGERALFPYCTEPIMAFVVPGHGYRCNELLPTLPNGAVPSRKFFSNRD